MFPTLTSSHLYSTVPSASTENHTSLMAGAAETIITPAMDELEVYGELYARALVLADCSHFEPTGNRMRRFLIVTLDHGGQSLTENQVLRHVISRATGILADNIIVNYSHSHNAPGPDARWRKVDQKPNSDLEPLFEEWLAHDVHGLSPWEEWQYVQIAEAAKRAMSRLHPAKLSVGRAPVRIAYNRRLMQDGRIRHGVNPHGPIAPWVDVLGVHGENGKRIAVLFSYAAHPVIVHHDWKTGSHSVIGPDYPGYAVNHLRNLLDKGGEPEGVFMFAQGWSGDVNAYPRASGDFNACDAAGFSLAFATARAIAESKEVRAAPMRTRSLTLSLPCKLPSVEECQGWFGDSIAYDSEGFPYGLGNLERLLEIAKRGERHFRELPLRAIAIGTELCLILAPGELFVEYQLFADEISPFADTVALGFTNDNIGYIGTRKGYELPGLTGGHGIAPNSTMPLELEAEGMVKEGIERLVNELKAECSQYDCQETEIFPENLVS